jgi:lactoylglutathione lyase
VGTYLSHVGICVSDLDRSIRFYCDGLGFEKAESFTVGDEFATLMEMDSVELTSQFLRRDGHALELLSFGHPEPGGARTRRPVNTFGLTHLSFRVDDVDEVAAKVQELGGTVHAETRSTMADGAMDFVYCSDPDGTRVELMRIPS